MKHKTTGEGTIQICCSWGKEIDDGRLTYRIDDDANPQVIQAVHQVVDEWNSKVPNIKRLNKLSKYRAARLENFMHLLQIRL
jgi:hypothetical protein